MIVAGPAAAIAAVGPGGGVDSTALKQFLFNSWGVDAAECSSDSRQMSAIRAKSARHWSFAYADRERLK